MSISYISPLKGPNGELRAYPLLHAFIPTKGTSYLSRSDLNSEDVSRIFFMIIEREMGSDRIFLHLSA